MIFTLTEDIIILSEPENQVKMQILEKEFKILSDFELNFSKGSDFEFNFFRHVRFWKKVCIQKITFWLILLCENEIFGFFLLFLKACFLIANFIRCQTLNWKKHNASDFQFEKKNNASCFGFQKMQRVRF